MLKANVSFLATKIEKKENNTALISGYQVEEYNNEKKYENISVWFRYNDKTVENVKKINEEITNNKYVVVELFSGNFNRNEFDKKDGTKGYSTSINTFFARVKENKNNGGF